MERAGNDVPTIMKLRHQEKKTKMLEFLFALAEESEHDKILYIAERFYNDLLIYARQCLRNSPIVGFEAEDAVQETYLRATVKIKYLDFTRSDYEIRRYMQEILRSIIANRRTREAKNCVTEHIDERIVSHDDFIEELMRSYEKEAVARVVQEMEERYRVPIMLKYFSGYSVKEIAELLEKPPKTIYTHIERGLLFIRKRLKQEGWGHG